MVRGAVSTPVQRQAMRQMETRVWGRFEPIAPGSGGVVPRGQAKEAYTSVTRHHRVVELGGGLTHKACGRDTMRHLIGRLEQLRATSAEEANATKASLMDLASVNVQVTHGNDPAEAGWQSNPSRDGVVFDAVYADPGLVGAFPLEGMEQHNCLSMLDAHARHTRARPAAEQCVWQVTPGSLDAVHVGMLQRHHVQSARCTVNGLTPVRTHWRDFRKFLEEHGGATVYSVRHGEARLVYVHGPYMAAAYVDAGFTGYPGIGHCWAVSGDGHVATVRGPVIGTLPSDGDRMMWTAGVDQSAYCTRVIVVSMSAGTRTYNGVGTIANLIREGRRIMRREATAVAPSLMVVQGDKLWSDPRVIQVHNVGHLPVHAAALIATAVSGLQIVPVGHTQRFRKQLRASLLGRNLASNAPTGRVQLEKAGDFGGMDVSCEDADSAEDSEEDRPPWARPQRAQVRGLAGPVRRPSPGKVRKRRPRVPAAIDATLGGRLIARIAELIGCGAGDKALPFLTRVLNQGPPLGGAKYNAVVVRADTLEEWITWTEAHDWVLIAASEQENTEF